MGQNYVKKKQAKNVLDIEHKNMQKSSKSDCEPNLWKKA